MYSIYKYRTQIPELQKLEVGSHYPIITGSAQEAPLSPQ